MQPIMHISANLSKISFKSTAINNNLINIVSDLSGNGYDATATGSVYLEEYEGIKAFSFKAQSGSTLNNSTLPAIGTSSFTLACTAASIDPAPLSNTASLFGVGGAILTGRCIVIIKSGTAYRPALASISDAGTTVNTSYDVQYKWNSYIFTFDSVTQNTIIYCNSISNFASSVKALNIISGYVLNALPAATYGSAKGYINEAMIFSQCLTDDQISGLFEYFQKNLSGSTAGYSKHKTRSPVFSRTL
jgi:hypothetical protein